MTRFNLDTLKLLWNDSNYPCISIYLPIVRDGNEVTQPPIRLNTILSRIEDHLRLDGFSAPQAAKILSPARDLIDSPLYWAFAQEGVAIFLSEQTEMILPLGETLKEQVLIDDHFVLRPLFEQDHTDFEFLLLAIGRGGARVYRGSRERLIFIPVNDFPESLESVISTYSFEKQRQQYGGSAGAVNHGFDNRKDRDHVMVQEYCRKIDARILEHWKNENLPLVVACVDDLFAQYQKISKNPLLMPANIKGSPDHLSDNELHQKAFFIVRARQPDLQKAAWENAQNYRGSERIRENIRQIIEAAAQGRVETLFIPRGQVLPGRYDVAMHRMYHHELDRPDLPFEAGDLYDQAAAAVLQNGGQVFMADPQDLPSEAHALAVLRY